MDKKTKDFQLEIKQLTFVPINYSVDNERIKQVKIDLIDDNESNQTPFVIDPHYHTFHFKMVNQTVPNVRIDLKDELEAPIKPLQMNGYNDIHGFIDQRKTFLKAIKPQKLLLDDEKIKL